MKKYESPIMEFLVIKDDVITSSLTNTGSNLDVTTPDSSDVNDLLGGN